MDALAGGEMASRTCCRWAGGGSPSWEGRQSIRQVADRLSGAGKAPEAAPGASLEVIGTESLTVLSGRAAGESIRRWPAAERPDSIFAANDTLAVGALQGLMLMGGVPVPQEIALIGHDDIEFAAAAVVPCQPGCFSPELVVRASTQI